MDGARVLLGVSGGIAAYKAAALTSTLVQRGAIVDVVMTAEAERFVAPLTFASLTARPVYASLWDAPERIPAHPPRARGRSGGRRSRDGQPDREARRGHRRRSAIDGVAGRAHSAHPRAGDERGDVRGRRDAGQPRLAARPRLRDRRPGARISGRARNGNGTARERGAHSRGDRARALAAAVAAREARRDHRRPDARSVRSGAFPEQRVDRLDRNRAGARGGAARRAGDAVARTDAAGTAGGRGRRARHDGAAALRRGARNARPAPT